MNARPMLVLGIAALAAALAPSAAGDFPRLQIIRISRAADGGVPNGPARHAAISQDKRFARLVAYESDATNIVPGAGGGTNVYVVERAQPYGDNGTPWVAGRTALASVGIGGAPANGPSTSPSLDGSSRVAPHCVAFLSAASNLVRGDTNGKTDAFVRDLRTGVSRRVSVDSHGRQSSGTTSEVAVNGLCTRVAFVNDGGDLALTHTRNRSWRSAVTRSSPPGRRQVYIRAIGGHSGLDHALRGLTFLASASGRGVPGNADSFGIAFANNSRALTFTSQASNLSARDANGQPDVYQRVMVRRYGRRVHGRSPQYLKMDTQLVSAGAGGGAGHGASAQPASNVDGTIVAFTTTAPDLIGGATSVPQVVQADLSGAAPRLRLASRTDAGRPGNGASGDPTVSAAGTWVMFQTAAGDVGHFTGGRPDTDRVDDVVLFAARTGERWVITERGATAPALDPMMSPHGNYVVFERGGQVQLAYLGPE
jgi:hypothetical protein